MGQITVARDLGDALRRCLDLDSRVFVFGEDILDPYGGAFKVTAGLSTDFPTRILTTPISEAGIVGVGIGAALRGLLPVVELMFGDFMTLAFDQLVNHAAKFPGMYNGKVSVPLVVRTPMGAGRGYGPTHSQSLEKHMLGVPGLRVVAPNHYLSPGHLLEQAILRDIMPVVFIEHKLMYPLSVGVKLSEGIHLMPVNQEDRYPLVRVRNYEGSDIRPDLTLITYGAMAVHLELALPRLAQEEIWVEAMLPTELSRTSYPDIDASCCRSGRVLVVEEGSGEFGWAGGIISHLATSLSRKHRLRMQTLNPVASVIPCAKSMESSMLIGADCIVDTVLQEVTE